MVYGPSERPTGLAPPTVVSKLLIAGGFGVGKTTLVAAISEVRPLRTEEDLSELGVDVDDTTSVELKRTTTVAMDFGRITFPSGAVLYLFGTPGQQRFWFMWDELAFGALAAVVLADTRRLPDCFSSIDYFERRDTPFVVAANHFDGSPVYDPADIRHALDVDSDVPVLVCDARRRESVKEVLIASVAHALTRHRSAARR
jgi:signal recognition particle receptor subunit beta